MLYILLLLIVVLPAFEKKCKKQQQQLKLEHSCPNLRSSRHIDTLDNSKVYSCCVWTICHRLEYLLLCTMQQENDQNVLYPCKQNLAESSLQLPYFRIRPSLDVLPQSLSFRYMLFNVFHLLDNKRLYNLQIQFF